MTWYFISDEKILSAAAAFFYTLNFLLKFNGPLWALKLKS